MKLSPPRSSAIKLLAGCLTFVAIGVAMAGAGKPIGFVTVAFFGLGIPVAVFQLLPDRCYLLLEDAGFTIRSVFHTWSIRWEDVRSFSVVTLRHGGLTIRRSVGFDFSPSYERSRTRRAIARRLGGSEGGLPSTYGMTAEELVALLEARRLAAQHAHRTPPVQWNES